VADITTTNSLVLDDGPHLVGTLTFGDAGTRTAAFSIDATAAGSLSISGGLVAVGELPGSNTALTIRGALTIQGDQTWTIGGVPGAADKGTGVAITGPVAGSIPGNLQINGTLTKTGVGQLTISGTTWGNGSVAVNSGSLRFHAALGKTVTVGGSGTSGQIVVGDGAQVFFFQDTTGDFGSAAAPSVTKPFVFNGASNIQLSSAESTDVTIGSPLNFQGTHSVRLYSDISGSGVVYRFSGDVSGAGAITLESGGSGERLLILSGDNRNFAGTMTVGGRNVLRLTGATAGSAKAVYSLIGANTAIESVGSAELVLGGLSGFARNGSQRRGDQQRSSRRWCRSEYGICWRDQQWRRGWRAFGDQGGRRRSSAEWVGE
jgi:hypothetical protein